METEPEEEGEPLPVPGEEEKGTNTRMGSWSAGWKRSRGMAANFSVRLEMKEEGYL